ncbi:MAG TPA: GNAT family N-acetyltransferase [Methylomirabilota bacterium]|nr:GNAT family N-acetyltransferase [Methylomirabilota bacterium]
MTATTTSQLPTSVTLKDGSIVTLRPIRSEDESELTAFYARLSPESAYQRFHTLMARLPPDWAHFLANVDYGRRMAIVAVDPEDRLIAVARYDYTELSEDAEVAIVVQDQWQGKGLGTKLMTELLRSAGAKGIVRFRAYVLADNHRMLDMFTRVTRVLERHTERGITSLLLAPLPRTEPVGRR